MRILLKLLFIITKFLLWLIDSDHRKKYIISNDELRKFTHIEDTIFKSDFGIAKKIFRTVPYEVWELKTQYRTITAADKHLLIKKDYSTVWLQDLTIGEEIQTNFGLEKVTNVRSLGFKCHMYCIEVNTENQEDKMNHLYYTNGFLSHNTTCAAGFLLWKAMFTPDSTILVAANIHVQAIEIMDRIKFTYENLPNHIRAGVLEYNKQTVVFDNGSRIVSRATSPNTGRGLAVSLLYLDEFAFVMPNKAKDFWTSIQPVLSTGGSCIITSTPNSDEDQFAQIWKGAKDNTDEYGNPTETGLGKNGFFAIEVPWWEHPDRDEKWAETYRQQLGENKFRQEMCCEFLTSDETLINPLTLTRLKSIAPIYYTGTMRWFKDPVPNKAFLVGLDPSYGTGGDNAAIQIFQMPEMEQIAEWQHNETAPRNQVRVMMQGLIFLDGVLRDNPEQQGEPEIYWTVENNSIGEAILQIIEDTGEDRFPGFFISEKKKKGQIRRFRKGMYTTTRSKASACARLKSLIESDRLKINSKKLITELKSFVSKENSFSAKSGEHDDLVSALLLIVRMLEVTLNWTQNIGELREYIEEDELSDAEPMPFIF